MTGGISRKFNKREEEMKAVDLAYMAGIVDGEGCIAIDRFTNKNLPSYCYRLKLRVTNTNHWLIEQMKYYFGGNIKTVRPRNEKVKQAWEWYLAGKPASLCLKFLLPYLHIKKPQAELGIRFQAGKQGKGHYLTDKRRAIEETEWILAKSMNKRGG